MRQFEGETIFTPASVQGGSQVKGTSGRPKGGQSTGSTVEATVVTTKVYMNELQLAFVAGIERAFEAAGYVHREGGTWLPHRNLHTSAVL